MKTVRKGSSGASVRLLQERLNANGFDVGTVDGIFGPATHKAVEKYQGSKALTVDGIVGPATWSALMSTEAAAPVDVVAERKDELRELAGDTPGLSAVRTAIDDLGAKEIPDGSNYGPEIDHLVEGYNEFHGIRGSTHYPWCAMAVSTWIGISLGLGTDSKDMKWSEHPFGKFEGGCSGLVRWGKKNDCFHSPSDEGPVPTGSIFLIPRSGSGSDASSSPKAGHTGLVVCDNGDGTVTTIEGNTSNRVKSLTRKRSSLLGYVAWWSKE